MMRKLLTICVVLLFASSAAAYAVPTAGRTWEYGEFTTLISPSWAFTVMGSHAYEFSRTNDPGKDEKETYFYEFFAGPVYSMRFGNLTLKLPLWYYYQGFPVKAIDKYYYSHNIEFLPILEYKYNRWKLWNRVIFHNKIYSSFYDTSDQRKGYSLLVREYLRVEYSLTDKFRVMVGDEIFQGIIEDDDTVDSTPDPLGGPGGFEKKGFALNRFYAGFGYSFTPSFSVTPMYMYQTAHFGRHNKVTEKDHYLFITLSYVLKLY